MYDWVQSVSGTSPPPTVIGKVNVNVNVNVPCIFHLNFLDWLQPWSWLARRLKNRKCNSL